jgi:SulP family sulfate permease
MARTRYQASSAEIALRELPAAALRAVLREGYRAEHFRADLLAGVVVGVVALPLAMALAIAIGVPPQHGLYTAAVTGIIVAALGGSRTQVTGPTAAFIVILAPIFAEFGLAGLLVSGALAGLMLLIMGALRLGGLIQFIPHPVTTGFTAGIGVVIAVLQVKDLFGLRLLHTPDAFIERVHAMYAARGTASAAEAAMGAITLLSLLALPRVVRRVPAALIVLPLAALAGALLPQLIEGLSVATIADRFQTVVDGKVVHGIPGTLPLPALPWDAPGAEGKPFVLNYHVLRQLLPGAFAIALLGAIESLLSAVVADGMAGTRHDPDAELLALGAGNVVGPFFGAIPATGAIARTATNIRSGARSPIAAIIHGAMILLAILGLAPLLGYLPMSALAALLLLVAWNMSEARHFVHIVRVAPKSDVAVLLTCFLLTVTFDMVVGVSVGMVLAAFMFMRRMAEVTESRQVDSTHLAVPAALPSGVVVYEISGPLFFGAVQKAMTTLHVVAGQARAVVFLMGGVHALDVTGLVAFESALDELRRRHCRALLCGVRKQPLSILTKAGVHRRRGVELHPDAASALASLRSPDAEPPRASGAPAPPNPDRRL